MGEKALYFPHTMRNPKVPCNYIVFGLSAGVACRIWRKTSGQMFISACNLAYSNMSPLIYLQQIQSSSFYDAPTLSSLLSHSKPVIAVSKKTSYMNFLPQKTQIYLTVLSVNTPCTAAYCCGVNA